MNREPRDRPADHELSLEALLQSARAIDPKLDELTAARIEARLSGQLADHRARGHAKLPRWATVAALSVAAALALLWLRRSTVTREPAPAVAQPSARPGVLSGNGAIAISAKAQPDLLTVYCIAGEDAELEPLRALLGHPISRIELTHAALVRAAFGDHARLSYQGPGILNFGASGGDEQSLIEVGEGQLIADFEGDGVRRLSIKTPHSRIDVVGTRFAVDVRAERSVLHVEHGTVQVEVGDRSVRVSDGETFDSGGRVARRGFVPSVLASLLRDHARSLLPPHAGEWRVLSVEGAGAGLRARLGHALLGPTPVAALVPLGEVAVTLEPDPAARHARADSRREGKEVRPDERSRLAAAEALYAAAEDCMRAAKSECARARLAELIRRFGQSPQAATARYELARLVQDAEGCTAASLLWRDYLRVHSTGDFAATAREQLSRCARAGSTP